jgi:hypothetical protein
VQPFDSGQAGELGPAIVAAGSEQRGVAHETLDLDGVHAGVEQVRGEGPPPVVRAEVADAGGPGSAVDQGVDHLGGEAPGGDPSGLVDGVEQRPLVGASELQPGGQRSPSFSRKGAAALTPTLASHGEMAGGGVVVLDVEGYCLGPAQTTHEEHREYSGVSAATRGAVGKAGSDQAADETLHRPKEGAP